jgi:hypothetical protein
MATGSIFARQIKECQNMLNRIPQSSPEDSESLAVIRKIIRCDECAPRQAAVCSVELRFFCVNHLVAYCYQRLEECEKAASGRQSRESVGSFLRECARQAAKLLLAGELQNADRARLFDLMLWANELFYGSIASGGGLTGGSSEAYFTVACRKHETP